MAKSKAKTVFFCKECGYETPKWMGQCPGCHQWNTMTEEKVSPVSKGTGKRGDNLPRQELTGLFEVSMEEEDRSSSGIPELDRVLGGGIVKGSLTLVGGDPGIGKSTLLLQICRYQANSGKKVVYVSGEESLKQIKMRAQRLGGFKQNVFLLCETDINAAAEAVREAKPDMVAGLIAVRKLHLRAIEETGLSAADEMLYPENWDYINDLLSYVAIGARSVEDQQHRLTVSGFDVASGMKNPTSGDFSVMLNSVYAAQHPHHFVHRGWEVDTTGNPLSHVILRGAVNKRGVAIPNYHYEDLIRLNEMYEKMDLVNPACIVDANHSNSNKKYAEQVRIVKEVMHNRKESDIIHKLVKGVMIESYICPGNQKIRSMSWMGRIRTVTLCYC